MVGTADVLWKVAKLVTGRPLDIDSFLKHHGIITR